ncbi:MAG: distal tail protein Dit [Clostridia bacterium]|jgi:phage-related protein|nr:phage tail family protein [Clostridium sp.]DAE58902.1 MAG TPA: distal tail protein [Caudoviricetes sp.]
MAKIIWKNIDSETIPGLIITNIPPITKPKMKTSITKIDGRDGDIIEELGYESYTKSIGIGLARNYDIDRVMKYFTGVGELIISDEPDKVYKAQIIEKIDYERLIRFKTAVVKFYTQPYKYLKDEKSIILDINNETSLKITNVGLEKSKPIITLEGTGTIEISLNGFNLFKYVFPENETKVVIDSLEEEAYLDNVLKNRNMLGTFPIFEVGENTISWSGNLTKISIEPKSRWL